MVVPASWNGFAGSDPRGPAVWKLMTARNRSGWFMADLALQVAVVRDPTTSHRAAAVLGPSSGRSGSRFYARPGAEREENWEVSGRENNFKDTIGSFFPHPR
jgi:hypothetical protein